MSGRIPPQAGATQSIIMSPGRWCSPVTAPPGSGTSPRGTSRATQIVDLYHAREHLHDLARLLEFMLGDHKQAWLQERLADLDNGDIPAICAAGRVFPLAGKKAADPGTALGYFEHNARRMRHAHFKKLGIFAGSGAAEAGCKSIVAQRRKLSGMRWTVSGATGILTLRCPEASDRWEQIRIQPTEKPAA